MKVQFSRMNWGRVLLICVLVVILVIILNMVLPVLTNHVWSQPDQAQIAIQISVWSIYILLLLLTFGGAVGCTHSRNRASSAWHTHWPVRWRRHLHLKYGLWEFCYDGTGHPGPDYGS